MAVVSISRIQVRRGTALQGSGLPQLASGEFGWAIDAQELYIGNGSTSEGAPSVGNTKILTEHTNILDLVGQYTYRENRNIETSESVQVARTIVDRLDDRVSVRAFGVFDTESPSTQTQQIQKAIYELYLRDPISTSAPILHVEPGTFEITQTIYVPPFTTIIGAGKEQTIFKRTGNFPIFETISSDSFYNGNLSSAQPLVEPQIQGQNQSRRVRVEHLTLESTTAGSGSLLKLNSTRDSMFEHIKFKGPGATDEIGVEMTSKNVTVRTQHNKFIDCEFEGLGYAAFSKYNVAFNVFDRCSFSLLKYGISLGENLVFSQTGPVDNVVTLSTFNDIEREGLLIPSGTRNASVRNVYGQNVGGAPAVALYPVIRFGESGNRSSEDEFKRIQSLATDQQYINGGADAAPYYPEVSGPGFFAWATSEQITVNQSGVGSPFLQFRLPADTSKFYKVKYFYKSDDQLNPGRVFSRAGELEVYVNKENNEVEITDSYETTGDSAFDDNIKFTGSISSVLDSVGGTVFATNIFIENPNDEGVMTIKVTSRS